MARLDFFAAEPDQRAVLDFLFTTTDVRVFESYSAPGAEIREFSSTDDLARSFPLGEDAHGNGYAVLLKLWSPTVKSELKVRRVTLNPTACEGHTFRHTIDGGGVMQLYLGGVKGAVVTRSHFGHGSQKWAEAWGHDNGINWESLKKLSNRIQYHIRSRLAIAKAGSCAVLPKAYEFAVAGYALKLATQTPWQYEITASAGRPKRTSG